MMKDYFAIAGAILGVAVWLVIALTPVALMITGIIWLIHHM